MYAKPKGDTKKTALLQNQVGRGAGNPFLNPSRYVFTEFLHVVQGQDGWVLEEWQDTKNKHK